MNAASDCSVSPPGIAPCNASSCGGGAEGKGITSLQAENPEAYAARDFVPASCGLGRPTANPLSTVNGISGEASASMPAAAPSGPNSPAQNFVSREASAGASGLACSRQPQLLAVQGLGLVPPLSSFASTAHSLANRTGSPNGMCPFPRNGSPPAFAVSPSAPPRSGSLDPSTWLLSSSQASDRRTQLARQLSSPLASRASISPARVFGLQAVSPLRSRATLAPRPLAETFFGLCSSAGGSCEPNHPLVHGLLPSDSPAAGERNAVSHPGLVSAGSPPSTSSPPQARSCERQRPNTTAPSSASVSNFCELSVSASTSDVGSPSAANTLQETELCSVASPFGTGSAPSTLSNAKPSSMETRTDGEQESSPVRARPGAAPRIQATSGGPLSGEPKEAEKNDASAEKRKTNSVRWRASIMSNSPEKTPLEIRAKTPEARRRHGSPVRSRPRSTSTLSGQVRGTKQPQAAVSPSLSATLEASRGDSLRSRCRSPVPERSHSVARHQSALGCRGRRPPTTSGSTKSPSPECRARPSSRTGSRRPGRLLMPRAEVRPSSSGVLSSHSFSGGRLPLDIKELKKLHKHPLTGKPSNSLSSVTTLPAVREPNCSALRERAASVSVGAQKTLNKKGKATDSRTETPTSSPSPAPVRDACTRRKGPVSVSRNGGARSSSTRPVSRGRVSIDPAKKREKTESLASRSRSASPTPVDPVRVKVRRSASRLSGQSHTVGGTKGVAQRKTPVKQRTRSGTCIRPGSVVYEPSRQVVTPRNGSPAHRAASTVLTRRQRSRGRHSSARPLPRGMSQRDSSLSSSDTGEASSGSDTRSLHRLMRSTLSLKVRSMSSAFAEGPLHLLRPPSFELAASSDRSSPESRKASSTVSLCSGAASATEPSTLPGLGQSFLTVGVCAAAPEGDSDGRGSGSSTYRRASCASSVGAASSDWAEVPGPVASTRASRLPATQAQARRQHPGRDESDTEGGPGLAPTRSGRSESVSSGYSSTERRSPRLQESRAPQLRNRSTADLSPRARRPLAPSKEGTAPRGVQLPRLNLDVLGQSQEAPKRVESGEAPKKGPGGRAPSSAPHSGTEGRASTAERPRPDGDGALPQARETSDAARERAKGGTAAGTPRVPGDRDRPVQGRNERSPQSRIGTREIAERHGPPKKKSPEVAELSLPRRNTMREVSPRALAGAGAVEHSAVRQRASTSSVSHGRSRAAEETDRSSASQDSVAVAVKTTGGELRHSTSKEISLLKKSANAPPSPRAHVTGTQRAKPVAFPSRGQPTGAAESLSKKSPAGGASSIDLSESARREQERTRETPSRPRLSALPGSLPKSKVSPPGPPRPRASHWETPSEARDASDTHAAKARHPSGRADAGARSASVLSGDEGPRGGLEAQEQSDLTLQNSPNIKRPPLRQASVSSALSESPLGGAGGRGIGGARKNFGPFQGVAIAAKGTQTRVAAKARPSESSQANAGALLSPSDSLRTVSSSSPRRMQRPSGAKDLSRPGETRRVNLTASPASRARRSDSEIPSLRIEKSSRGNEGARRHGSGLPSLSGLGDSAEKEMARAGSALKVAQGKLAKKAPASPRDTRLLSRSLTRSSVLLELPGEKSLGGAKRPKAKASGKAAAGRKRADASPQKRTGKTQPVGAASKSQVVEESPKTPEFCVKDLPMPASRIQPRVCVSDGFFLPVREGPQLERSRMMRSFHQDLCRPGPRGLYDRRLYGMALELSLLMPTDLKNLKRWLHESVAEVEEERQELADVWGFLEVLPSFCMVNEPLDFVLAYRDETRWRQWGAGWMGKNGRPLPLPPDKLLRAFFFAEGLEGGPDWECKMMKREEENMRRFMKDEAEKIRKEEEHQRLLEKEAELQNLIRFKAKRWRQLQCMWEKLVEAIELHQRPRLSFVSSLDDGFPPSTSVATWLHPERQRASIATPWIAAPTYLSCCSDAVTGDPSEGSAVCLEGCVSSLASPAVSVGAAEPSVVTISSLSELQARARRSESYARAMHAMQQTPVMPSPDYVRHLFRERKFRELNTVFKALVGASIEDLWLHFDRQEAEAEAAQAAQAAAQEAQNRAVAAAEARRRRAEEARAREPLEREEMAREDARAHQCEAFTWKVGNLRRKKQEFLKSIPISPSATNAVELLMTKTKRGARPRSSGDTKLVSLRRAGSSSSASGPTHQKLSEKRDATPAGHAEALPRGQATQGLLSRRQSQMGISARSGSLLHHNESTRAAGRSPEGLTRLVRMQTAGRGAHRTSAFI
ncbi:putative proteophosphoglycan 5, related protein [Toxoplasma gondii p89]|uniref:Putative proteophosphoglycan 5, related protein n=1 Tax=Toxoplasma gondii p89 TaxID=943119 RepID=A0A086L144_TOXGO|nr:putative proteophosphoglycan 5, related protein [Toxoplasma gondii p89]